jgi:hypothetical protein
MRKVCLAGKPEGQENVGHASGDATQKDNLLDDKWLAREELI